MWPRSVEIYKFDDEAGIARRKPLTVPYDEKTAERVRRALGPSRDVVEKKMMGGLCFMVGGSMCCGVTRSALMVRVGREEYQKALAQPHVRPLEFAGRRPTGFVLVDHAGFRTEAALAEWIKRGIDFVSTLPRKNVTESSTGTVRTPRRLRKAKGDDCAT